MSVLAVPAGQDRPVDLVLHVAAEVPRHRLEPGDRVGGRPLLDGVVEPVEGEDGVLQRHLRGRVGLDVGVHPGAERLEVGGGVRVEQRELLLGHAPPAHRPDELVGVERVLAEHLREPAGGDVPADVHLVEAVLGLHEALRVEQVVRAVGVDLGHPVLVPHDAHVALQAGDGDLAVGLRVGLAHHDDAGHQGGHHRQADQDHGVRRPAAGARPGPEPGHRAGGRAVARGRLAVGQGVGRGSGGHGRHCAGPPPGRPPRHGLRRGETEHRTTAGGSGSLRMAAALR